MNGDDCLVAGENRNQLKSLLGIETRNSPHPFKTAYRNQLKSLLGIETILYMGRLGTLADRNQLKSLLGIETSWCGSIGKICGRIAIN